LQQRFAEEAANLEGHCGRDVAGDDRVKNPQERAEEKPGCESQPGGWE
jgi:hypothetical protein